MIFIQPKPAIGRPPGRLSYMDKPLLSHGVAQISYRGQGIPISERANMTKMSC